MAFRHYDSQLSNIKMLYFDSKLLLEKIAIRRYYKTGKEYQLEKAYF